MADEWANFSTSEEDPGRSLPAAMDCTPFLASGDEQMINVGGQDGQCSCGGRGRRGGRGGRGGRGSRGGRGGCGGHRINNDNRSKRDNSSNSNGDDGRDEGFRGGHRGKGGGRRGPRGGMTEKPREIYVPPAPTDDENEMFGSGISKGSNFEEFEKIRVQVSGENAPEAIVSFETSGLNKLLIENVIKSQYTKPTPIQKRAIPIILAGRDLMGCAQTGSGKTAAFLLPIIHQILGDKEYTLARGGCQPQAVIMLPTRELAIQIFTEARKFAYGSAIKTGIVYGGADPRDQSRKLLEGCHILVATTGRLLDFVERDFISFKSMKFVVLDEADRMLDMGFIPHIEKVMAHPSMTLQENRQTLMFSATFPEKIQHLAARFLKDYIFVTVGIVGGASSDVEQVFVNVEKFQKKSKLKDLLESNDKEQTLIFVETKRNADYIAMYVGGSLNLCVTSIHGDRLQRERETALNDFKLGRCNILVATAVAARGLDIKNVAHVINYDLPKTIDEYVHRIGRTGRLGNRGKATSFYDSGSDSALAVDLINILKQADQHIPDFIESSGLGSYSQEEFGGEDFRVDFNFQTTECLDTEKSGILF